MDFYESVPKDLVENLRYRVAIRKQCEKDSRLRKAVMAACREDVLYFFSAWCWLHEPRPMLDEEGNLLPEVIPFIPWPHQVDLIRTIRENLGFKDIGVEKARGEGMSWIALMMALHDWTFAIPGTRMISIGIVSRTMEMADTPGDMNSLMPKLDWELERLPKWMVGVKDVDYKRLAKDHTLRNLRNNSLISAYASTGEVGSGGRYAQPLDAKILTPTGWTTMGNLQVGHEVIGSTGKATNVTGVYPRGRQEVFEVTFSDGAKAQCTEDHLWSVVRCPNGCMNGEPMVLPLWEIRKDYVQFVGKARKRRNLYAVPLVKPVEFNRKEKLPVDPYLLGCLLGDGGLTRVGITFTTADQEILDILAKKLPKGVEIKHRKEYSYAFSVPGSTRNPLVQDLRRLGLMGISSPKKSIPEMYQFASVPDRIELLRGLMDTDGCVVVHHKKTKSSTSSFAVTSKALAYDVKALVESLGGTATMCKLPPSVRKFPESTSRPGSGPRYCNTKAAYRVTLGLPPGINPFRLTRKAEKFIEKTRYLPGRRIVDIQSIGTAEVQCISVDAPDGLYITNDHIVTHNTWWLIDELSKFPPGNDADALTSTQASTKSRLIIGTPYGSEGAYYDVMHQPSSMIKLTLKWEDNPTRNRGLYRMVHEAPVAIDPINNPLPPCYTPPNFDTMNMLLRLRRNGFKLEKGLRSPWYDTECDRPNANPFNIAQELDRDYGGSMYKIFTDDFFTSANETVRPPFCRVNLTYDEELRPTVTRAGDGELLLWMTLDAFNEPPRHPYVLGVDICTGIGGAYTSNSVIQIIDAITKEQVGEYAANTIAPDDLADLSVAICNWLGNAYLAWERNGPGNAYTARIKEIGYPNVYLRTKLFDKRRRKKAKEPGWWTDTKSKEILFSELKRIVAIRELKVHGEQVVQECQQYIRIGRSIEHVANARGDKDSPDRGESHGDRVIALGIAVQALRDRPVQASAPGRPLHVEPGSIEERDRFHYEAERAKKYDDWDDRSNWDLMSGNAPGAPRR